MKEYIKKIQSKPEESKKQILFWSLALCMSLVCFVWVSSLGPRFSKEKIAETKKDIKPFALFGQAISDTYNNVSASVGSIPSKNDLIEEAKQEEVKDDKQIDLIPVDIQ